MVMRSDDDVRGALRRTARWATLCVAHAASLGGTARAQDDAAPTSDAVSIEQREGYVDAVRKIATGEEEAGLAELATILARHGDDPDIFMLHYNVACGHARRGELDPAFAALDLAVRGGYGIHPGRRHNLEHDPDLASLRGDVRYAEAVSEAHALAKAIESSWDDLTAAFEFVPPPTGEATEDPKPLPLLIVLHPYGAERAEFARRWYEPFCAEHRFALLAPSGRRIIAPERFAFFSGASEFIDLFRLEQRQVIAALEALKKRVAIDPERIYVTGCGQGAGFGFALAMRNPQWVRGAVLFDGGYAPATLKDWETHAVRFGRRVALVHRDGDPRYPLAPLEDFATQLASRGLQVELFAGPAGPDRDAKSVGDLLAARLAWIDKVPFQRGADGGW
jgi:predicted esterase